MSFCSILFLAILRLAINIVEQNDATLIRFKTLIVSKLLPIPISI